MQRSRRLTMLVSAMIGVSLAPGGFGIVTAPLTAAAAEAGGTDLRVATFNVRTARALQDRQHWLERAPRVADEILARSPGVVALQELGPGRADGIRGTLRGTQRQTGSLLSSLAALGGDRYKLVRTTSYVPPGTAHGTQGARILYDSLRYSLLSDCPDTTDQRSYNPSCSIELPLDSGDSDHLRRTAAYASFEDRQTGRKFYVVSAHLDSRHSRSASTESRYNDLRARQAATVAETIEAINPEQLPVVFGGDINSWQHDRGHYAPHRVLENQGYQDAVEAKEQVNIAYSTINHFDTELKRAKNESAARLDVVMVKGADAIERYENKTERVDTARPSDHNMVVADLVI